MKNIGLICLIFLFSICAAAQGGSIAGKVTFGSDNAVLHEVSVQIVQIKRSTVTDNDGGYRFENVPPGRYTILAHQEGFADASKLVTVTEGSTITVDLQMQLSGITEQVTVTASGAEQTTFEAIATVSSIESNEIMTRASVGLGEVLEGQSGVSERSAGPGASRPVIRGFDGDRVKVASDGISAGSLAAQSGDHSEPIDPLSVERIEVVKGPATLLYGSSAIGGVVNAISGHDEESHPGVRGYFSTIGATNSILVGGKLRLVENEEIRYFLASLPELISTVKQTEANDYATLMNLSVPYFSTHGDISQIVMTMDSRPGGEYRGERLLEYHPRSPQDHVPLLKDARFLGIVTGVAASQVNVVAAYDGIQPKLERVIGLLDAELERLQ